MLWNHLVLGKQINHILVQAALFELRLPHQRGMKGLRHPHHELPAELGARRGRGYRIASSLGCGNPGSDGVLKFSDRFRLRFAKRGTARQILRGRDEALVLIAPEHFRRVTRCIH